MSGTYLIGIVLMILIGLAGSIQMTLGQALTIEATDDRFRARVMSLTMMSYGLMPLGALPMGLAVDEIGATATLAIAGGILCLVALTLLLRSNTLRSIR